MNVDASLIEKIKRNEESALKKLYEGNRKQFISFAKRYTLDKETITDIYQDAFIALCENAKKGKMDDLKSSISTYLFGIGKFMVFQYLKKKKKMVIAEEIEAIDFDYEAYEEENNERAVLELRKAFEAMGEQCKRVLQLFYYEERKLDEIMHLLDYSNKDVLKSQKSRCMKKLKDLIKIES